MQNYEWLLFDADGTLFDYERAKGTALIEVFQSIRGRRPDMRT
jgi:phosphoglycolate phosphatase-like HAD superfamily hydrolase